MPAMNEKQRCGDCVHFEWCEWFIAARANWEKCDWEPPSRFRARPQPSYLCPQCGCDWSLALGEWDWNRTPYGREQRCTCGALLRIERLCLLRVTLVEEVSHV